MDKGLLSVREATVADIDLISTYWFTATPEHLKNMGVDSTKLPKKDAFEDMLKAQLLLPYNQKKAYALIWEYDSKPIGHCNLNPAIYGDHAYMHLHLWNNGARQKGLGTELVKMALPYFFENMQLTALYCEPYALNPAPNRILEKTGFKFVKEYITTPGAITFEQPVKLWEMKRK